jgi:hypothetical protein
MFNSITNLTTPEDKPSILEIYTNIIFNLNLTGFT